MTHPFLTRCRECDGAGFVPTGRGRNVTTCPLCDGDGTEPTPEAWWLEAPMPELAPASAYEGDDEAQDGTETGSGERRAA